MIVYTVSREDLEQQAARVAEAMVLHLIQHGLITDVDKAGKFLEEWTPVLIPRRSILDRLRDLVFLNKEEKSGQDFLIRFAKLKC